MKCKVGDRVRFLNDVGGGKVTRIDRNTVFVLGDDGFEVPVLSSEIIVVDQSTDSNILKRTSADDNNPIFGHRDDGSRSQQIESNQDIIETSQRIELPEINFSSIENDDDDPSGELVGIFLAFFPDNQAKITESDHELYIINDSPYRAFYCISRWEGESVIPIRAGFLYPDTKELIKAFKRESLNEDIVLNIQSLLFKNTKYTPQQPEFYDLRINPTKFFKPGSFIENDFFEERALIFSLVDSKKEEILKTLTDKAIESVIKNKDSSTERVEKPKQTEEVEEVDLHIEELIDNPKNFTPGQLLEIQMARFKVALDGGIKSKTKKMVFIHGVGNGKLKHEIRKELEKNFPKLRYQDASFREYGYGATMVFIKS